MMQVAGEIYTSNSTECLTRGLLYVKNIIIVKNLAKTISDTKKNKINNSLLAC